MIDAQNPGENLAGWHASVTPALRKRRQECPEDHWSANLVESAIFRCSERPGLKT